MIKCWLTTLDEARKALEFLGQEEDLSMMEDTMILGYSIEDDMAFVCHESGREAQGLILEEGGGSDLVAAIKRCRRHNRNA